MTTRELLELASLDAMGLLEDREREGFERAFRAAAPAVQRQVRREQERLTGDTSTLPEVDPPAELRGQVIGRVREAMTAARSEVVGKIVPSEFSLRANVSPLWRAACIGFATATLVLFGVGYSLQSEYRDALAAGQSGEIAEMARLLGPEFEQVLLSPTAERLAFATTASDDGGDWNSESGLRAAIYLDPETKTAFLVCRNLPSADGESGYRLVVLNEDDSAGAVLKNFEYTGGLVGTAVPVDVRLTGGGRLGIVSASGGSPVMLSI